MGMKEGSRPIVVDGYCWSAVEEDCSSDDEEEEAEEMLAALFWNIYEYMNINYCQKLEH